MGSTPAGGARSFLDDQAPELGSVPGRHTVGSENQDCPREQKVVTTFSAAVSSSPGGLGQREETDLGLVEPVSVCGLC